MENAVLNAGDIFTMHFGTRDEANAAAEKADVSNYRVIEVEKGDFVVAKVKVIEAGKRSAPKVEKPVVAKVAAKPKAKVAAVKAKPAPKAKAVAKPKVNAKAQKAEAKADAEQAKAKAVAARLVPPKAAEKSVVWRKLDGRRWIGKWAELADRAAKGMIPDVGGAKVAYTDAFPGFGEAGKGMFAAATHNPFKRRIENVLSLIRARDIKGLKALEVNEVSTTPTMIAKLRDLGIAAMTAKAEKPAKAPRTAKAA